MNAKEIKQLRAKIASLSKLDLEQLQKEASEVIAAEVSEDQKENAKATLAIVNELLSEIEAGRGPKSSEPENKSGMVQVRAGKQPVHVDGIHIDAKSTGWIPAKRLASLGNLVTKIGCIVLFAMLALFATSVRGAQYSILASTNSFTIATNGASTVQVTNSTSLTVGATKYDSFDLHLRFKLMAAGTDDFRVNWQTGDDGTNFCTVGSGQGSFVVPCNGTTTVDFATNITMNSRGYWRCQFAGSTNAPTTNGVAEAWGKPSRNGS